MPTTREIPEPLRRLLKQGSRSFYLSIAVLPPSLRAPIGLAYLLARAADTIADTRLLPAADRLRQLALLRGALDVPLAPALHQLADLVRADQPAGWQRELVEALPDCHALLWETAREDRERVQGLLALLIHGMQRELERFPAEDGVRIGALETREELRRHAYYAAGCVGEFWTGMAVAHCPGLAAWDVPRRGRQGMRFGQGLQLTNILRDLPRDLRIGRCYLPRQELARLGLTPEALLDPAVQPRLRPLLEELLAETLDCYADGRDYTLAVPATEWRLRLACAWPLLIGLATLARVRREPALLDPTVSVKIRRAQVYTILVRSTLLSRRDRALLRYWSGLEADARNGESPRQNA